MFLTNGQATQQTLWKITSLTQMVAQLVILLMLSVNTMSFM